MLTSPAPPIPPTHSSHRPPDADQYPELRDALLKLQLNDAALKFEPEVSSAMGFGFRCGFWACCTWRLCRCVAGVCRGRVGDGAGARERGPPRPRRRRRPAPCQPRLPPSPRLRPTHAVPPPAAPQERLEREYDLDLITTAPTVVFKAVTLKGDEIVVDCPSKLPEANRLDSISEPYVRWGWAGCCV